MIKKRQVLWGFGYEDLQCARKHVFPRNMRSFQHLEGVSHNAYKHNGFPMILTAYLRKGLQNDQETTGFIRVRRLDFAVCEKTSFPKECEWFPTSRMCIT